MLKLVHSVPGRFRLQSDRLRGNALLIEALQERISQIGGVDSVRPNWSTGSVVVVYDPALCSGEAMLRELGEIEVALGIGAAADGNPDGSSSPMRQFVEAASSALVEALAKRSATALISALV